jgi:tetratricopeptide (TPR) repeat protein
MVCAGLSRRLAAAAAALAVALGAGSAFAQSGSDAAFDRTRRAGAVTTFGTPAAQVCVDRLTQGDTSDLVVEACSRAISEEVSPATRIGLYVNRGVLRMRRGEPEMALVDFDAAIDLDRRSGEAYQNRGAALIAMGQHGPAIAALTEALGLGVREPQKAYLNRGIAREALGDERGALEDFTTALDIEPGWTAANEELARIARLHQEHLAAILAEDAAP